MMPQIDLGLRDITTHTKPTPASLSPALTPTLGTGPVLVSVLVTVLATSGWLLRWPPGSAPGRRRTPRSRSPALTRNSKSAFCTSSYKATFAGMLFGVPGGGAPASGAALAQPALAPADTCS